MSACQRPEELHERVMARVDELTAIVQQRIPGFARPNVGYFTGRAAAGLAYFQQHRIELHRELLRENVEDMIHDTIAHEMAHLVCYALAALRRIPGNGRGHGRHWQGVMRGYFGIEPSRTHSYDMTNAGVKRQHRWLYTCGCPGREIHLSTVRHNKAQHRVRMGGTSGFRCRVCRAPIEFAEQRVS
jgi:SprT protein